MLSCKNTYFILIFVLLFTVTSLAATAGVEAAKVAVVGFESRGLPWTSNRDLEEKILEGLASQYTEKLAGKDIVNVVDRARVKEVLEQMGYEPGDSLDLSAAAQVGRMVDSNLLILGSVESLEVTEKGEVTVGPFTLSGVEVEVELTARLVNAATAGVLTTYSGSASKAETGIEISDLQGISFGTEAFADSAVGKAIDEALTALTEDTAAQKEMFAKGTEVPEVEVLEAEVMAKVGDSLVIDKGSEDGVREDMEGSLQRKLQVEDREEPLSVTLGEVVVSSVDSNTALVSVREAEESPETGDIVKITLSAGRMQTGKVEKPEFSSSYIKKIETPDFVIYIDRVTRDGDEVTFHGTADAKGEDTELTLMCPSDYSFYDNKGQRIEIDDRIVTIGKTSDHGDRYPSPEVTEFILAGYPTNISWTIDRVPEEADHLARVKLYLETPAAGEVEINLDGVSLLSQY